jgi:hypothetical protein
MKPPSQKPSGHDFSSSPGHARLARLALSDVERAALEGNGFVSAEWRGRKRRFKLRFRVGGKQRIRFLGHDPAVAASVAGALVELQRPKRAIQQLRAVCRAGRTIMRAGREQLTPLLAPHGVKFHGYALRRSRSTTNGAQDQRFQQRGTDPGEDADLGHSVWPQK